MLSKFYISGAELRAVAPRVALYTAVAYVTVRAISSAVKHTSRWVGLDDRR